MPSDIIPWMSEGTFLFVLISPFSGRNTVDIFEGTGKMQLIFISNGRTDIRNR